MLIHCIFLALFFFNNLNIRRYASLYYLHIISVLGGTLIADTLLADKLFLGDSSGPHSSSLVVVLRKYANANSIDFQGFFFFLLFYFTLQFTIMES